MNELPPDLHTAQCYERHAEARLPAPVWAYIQGGSGRDWTVQANRDAWPRWPVMPRVLADVRAGHAGLTLAGRDWPWPIMLAPVAHQRLVHPQAERATAAGAAAVGVGLCASTLSSEPVEAIAEAGGPGALRWFQLYLQPTREETWSLVQRAVAAGCQAIVLTLDAVIQLPSVAALQAGFVLPPSCTLGNWQAGTRPRVPPVGSSGSRVFQGVMQQAPRWDDLDWLLAHCPVPVWVKGVLDPRDALALKARGVQGLVVSNHGGRGLDGSPPTAAMLPKVRQAVGPDWPLIVDGGIRSGTDIFRALALGAQAVMIGRLQLHALAVGGALGVAHMLRLLAEELETCMAMAGCARLADIGPDALCLDGLAVR